MEKSPLEVIGEEIHQTLLQLGWIPPLVGYDLRTDYAAWRVSFQSDDQAARSAFIQIMQLVKQLDEQNKKVAELNHRIAAISFSHDVLVNEYSKKITAIHSGGDWSDAQADYLILADGMDISEQKKKWHEWYKKFYCGGENIEFISFIDWLLKNGATRATSEHINVLDEIAI